MCAVSNIAYYENTLFVLGVYGMFNVQLGMMWRILRWECTELLSGAHTELNKFQISCALSSGRRRG